MPFSETAKVRQYVWPWIHEGRGIDLGCGFDRVHPRCVTVDAAPAPAVDVVGDITDLSHWEDGEFDWVFSSHALEDIPDTAGALREWLRVLRPGGTILLYCPYRHYYPNVGDPGANPAHVHDFVPSDIVSALRAVDPDIWIVTAEVRGRGRQDEFHEYSCLVVARKGRPARPEVLIENNHQIGDTLSAIPLCRVLRETLPDCRITVAVDKAGVLDGHCDTVGREDRAYDLIVHQRTSTTERGDWLRRTTHFTQFTPRVCGELLPEVLDKLPDDPKEPLELPYYTRKGDRKGLPKLPTDFVAVATETYPPRRWPHERWRTVVRWLLDEGVPVVLLGEGAPGEMDDRAVDLRGRTTFRQACAAMSKARLLLSVDTSFVHAAHSLGVPAAVLMGPSGFDTTFYPDTTPLWRPAPGCVGCYNWASDESPFDWEDGRPSLPVTLPTDRQREGRQIPMYTKEGCRDFMSGVGCMSAIRTRDVQAAVARLLDLPEPPPARALTAVWIALNEEEDLPRSLDSVVGLADAVVVADTGSTDRTVEVAEEWSARTGVPLRVARTEWRDDFAAAKNFAAEHVETSHFVWLDADDIMEDPLGVRELFDSTEHDVYQLWTDIGSTRFLRERIVPKSARWLYPIHECLDIRGLSATEAEFAVLHRPSRPQHWRGSLDRNRRILEVWLEREPDSDRATFYLAETLRQQGDWDGAAPLYRRHFERGTDWTEALFQSAYQVARCHLGRKEWREAAEWGLRAIRTDPVWREGYYVVGDAYFWMGLNDIAYAWFLAAHNVPRPDRKLWKDETIYGHLPATQLSYCCERAGNIGGALKWAEAALPLGGPQARVDELRGKSA